MKKIILDEKEILRFYADGLTSEEYYYNLLRTNWTIVSSLEYIKCSNGEIKL